MNIKSTQAEMIYMSLLHTLRENGIQYNEKHETLSNELLERHEASGLLDLLDGLHDFIVTENEFDLEEEDWW